MQIDLRFSYAVWVSGFKRISLDKIVTFSVLTRRRNKFNREALFNVGIKVTNICVVTYDDDSLC